MLQVTPDIERFRSLKIPEGFEAAIVKREAERHGCDVIPDVHQRMRNKRRCGLVIRTTTLHINKRLCLLKRAHVAGTAMDLVRRSAHFDFRTERFHKTDFAILRVEQDRTSRFFVVPTLELIEWYGDESYRISLAIPVPEYPVAYSHAAFDWASYRDAWHLITPRS